MDLAAVTEALLVASETPLTASELARLIRARIAEIEDHGAGEEGDYAEAPTLDDDLSQLSAIDEEAIIAAIATLNRRYERGKRSFVILERAKGWKIYTRPEFGGFVRQLFPGQRPRKLSPPALETLAIIAYRQPITKASIEHVRGVACDSILQKLLDRELVRIDGRADLPGRPLLYATTDFFFEHFGIKTIDELPNASELRTVELPEPPTEDEADGTNDAAPDNEGDASPDNDGEAEQKQLALVEPTGEPTPEEPAADFSAPDEGAPGAN